MGPAMMKTNLDSGKETAVENLPRGMRLAMADALCTSCGGTGCHRKDVCKCVWRQICRVVIRRVHENLVKQGNGATFVIYDGGHVSSRKTWGRSRPAEEFIADAWLIAKRELKTEEWSCFQHAMLCHADWRQMTRRMGLDRGNYYHLFYRTEAKLGRAWATARPYSLFPLDEYFHGRSRQP